MSKCILNTMTMSSTEDSSEPLSSSTLAICDTAVSDRHHSPTITRRSLLIRMVFILYIYLSVCVFCTSGATATRSPPVGTKLSNYSQTTPSPSLFSGMHALCFNIICRISSAYSIWCTGVSQLEYARIASAIRPYGICGTPTRCHTGDCQKHPMAWLGSTDSIGSCDTLSASPPRSTPLAHLLLDKR